jgi:hypothetical protein
MFFMAWNRVSSPGAAAIRRSPARMVCRHREHKPRLQSSNVAVGEFLAGGKASGAGDISAVPRPSADWTRKNATAPRTKTAPGQFRQYVSLVPSNRSVHALIPGQPSPSTERIVPASVSRVSAMQKVRGTRPRKGATDRLEFKPDNGRETCLNHCQVANGGQVPGPGAFHVVSVQIFSISPIERRRLVVRRSAGPTNREPGSSFGAGICPRPPIGSGQCRSCPVRPGGRGRLPPRSAWRKSGTSPSAKPDATPNPEGSKKARPVR